MKTFYSEDMRTFVNEHLASGEGIVECRSKVDPQSKQTFIRLPETIACKLDWRGNIVSLNAGDYIHADPNDFYPISAEQFNKCFTITN